MSLLDILFCLLFCSDAKPLSIKIEHQCFPKEAIKPCKSKIECKPKIEKFKQIKQITLVLSNLLEGSSGNYLHASWNILSKATHFYSPKLGSILYGN